MWSFLWSMLELLINLKTFGESLINKKSSILIVLKNIISTSVLWQMILILLWSDFKFTRLQFHEY
jgi:hypothetical protein